MRGRCLGYERPICWRSLSSRNSVSKYCATCQAIYDKDLVIQLTSHIKKGKELDVLTALIGVSDTLARFTQTPILDNLLVAIYRRNTLLLAKCITYITQNSKLNPALQIRITNHTDSLCPVYSWIVRNGITNITTPASCLKCLASDILYGNSSTHMFTNLDFILPTDILPRLIDKTMKLEDNDVRVRRFVISAFESGNSGFNRLITYLGRKYPGNSIIQGYIELHPFNIAKFMELYHSNTELDDLKKLIYSYLKVRTDLFKEELIAKTWHPSRLFSWCLDIEDIEFMSQ